MKGLTYILDEAWSWEISMCPRIFTPDQFNAYWGWMSKEQQISFVLSLIT